MIGEAGVEELADAADTLARTLSGTARRRARSCASRGCPPTATATAVYEALGAEGFIGIHWPGELGGRGLSSLHTLACEERFGYHWLPLSGYLLSVKTIGNALLRFGTEELQRRLIPEVAAGRLLFCQGFSEPDAGSDLASLRTQARHGPRPVRRQRPQDLDLERRVRRLGLPGRAHGSRAVNATAVCRCSSPT